MQISKIETFSLLIPDFDSDACSSAQDNLVVKISTDEGLEYFVVHKDADVEHREQSAMLMNQLSDEERILAEEAGMSTVKMLWAFLSGLCDKHDIKN